MSIEQVLNFLELLLKEYAPLRMWMKFWYDFEFFGLFANIFGDFYTILHAESLTVALIFSSGEFCKGPISN